MNLTISHDRASGEDGFYRANDSNGILDTVKRVTESLDTEGIVEKTALDRTGIPCFSFIRKKIPIGGYGLHYGADLDEKRAMAYTLLSAIEGQSSEYHGDRMDILSFEEIGFLKGIMPDDLILPKKMKENEKVHWSTAFDIMDEKEMLVPSNAVFYPYDCLGMVEPIFRSNKLGIAAGSTVAEAVLYGMYDVILIDALSHAETERDHGRKILLEEKGLARDMMDRLDAAGINVNLWSLPSRTGLPCVVAAADDDISKRPGFLVSGFGAHQDPEIAAILAMNDVVKERIDYIENGQHNPVREAVLEKTGYDRLKRINRLWYGEGETVEIDDIGSSVSGYLDDDIDTVIGMLEDHADHVLVADLTRTEVPVVRVIIPGFHVSHLDTGRSGSNGFDDDLLRDDGLFSTNTGGRDFQPIR